MHNLFFTIAGSLFGKNYFLYHLLTFTIHIFCGFFVYKVIGKIARGKGSAILGGLLYTISPIHFVSLFWISGGATILGFFFLIASFYSYLEKRFKLSFILFLIALLASEAMVVGIIIFLAWEIVNNKKVGKFLLSIGSLSLVFTVVRTTLLNPGSVSESYKLDFSKNVFLAFKYYVLRIFWAVDSGDMILIKSVSLILMAIIISFAFYLFLKNRDRDPLIFLAAVILCGFFPFILIPNHLSPHYMNISTFGLAMLGGITLCRSNNYFASLMITALILLSVLSVENYTKTHWVVMRANLSRVYIEKIEMQKLPYGSAITFGDSHISTSKEAYISLGQGKALDFWFKGKNYKSCFNFYQKCPDLNLR